MSRESKLAELGIDAEQLSDEQRAVLTSLPADELEVLASVKDRLESAGGDVQGHVTDIWGGIGIF